MGAKRKNPGKGKNVFIVSLGCHKNLVDTEVMTGVLLSNGYQLVFDDREADYYLINTCAFLPEAREEACSAIREAAAWKKKKSDRKIIVAGCLNEWDKDNVLRSNFPEVDYFVPIDAEINLAAILEKESKEAEIFSCHATFLYDENTPRLPLTMPHLAYLKIADGCDNCCSYCAIPSIRGSLRSRSIHSVVEEAKNLIAMGVVEIILIAQDITVFGHDRDDGASLTGLLRELDKLDGDFQIRLLYTHPAHYTDELIEYIATSKHVLPYLDIPLQHVNDRILKAMGRFVGKKEVVTLIEKLRAKIPHLALRTTYITGFPGETEDEFAELRGFMQEYPFEHVGVFAYSAEPGTPAAAFPAQNDRKLGEKRAQELMALQAGISLKLNRRRIGCKEKVLIDFVEDGIAYGRSSFDASEIDNQIIVRKGHNMIPGKIYELEIVDATEYCLEAKRR